MIGRIKYLDYAKGIGILLIMMAHSIQYFKSMQGMNDFITSFHVPIFFIVSGYLAYINREKDEPFIYYIKRKARSLLVPYVFFSLFNSALKISVLFLKHEINTEIICKELIELLITGNGTVWFLVTLFGVEISHKIIRKIIGKEIQSYLVLSVILLVLPYLFDDFINFSIGIVIIRIIAGLGFYFVGYVLSYFHEGLSVRQEMVTSIFIILFGVISFNVVGSNYSFFEGYFSEPIVSLSTGLFLSAGTVMLCKSIESCCKNKVGKILEWYGKNSLIVMLVHPTILLFITYPLGKQFWNMTGICSFVLPLILFIFIVVAEIPFVWIINRWFPWLIGKPLIRGN